MPGFFVFSFIILTSFHCNDDSTPDTGKAGNLESSEIEMFAQVTEHEDYFEISGYLKSLNTAMSSSELSVCLNIDVIQSDNLEMLQVERTVDGITDNSPLYKSGDWIDANHLWLESKPLDLVHTECNFSVKFYKNISYKFQILSLYSANNNGITKEKDGSGCNEAALYYGILEERTFEINQTIESF